MGGVTLGSNLFSMQTNTWYHIAITRNNTGTVSFYVNGQSMGSGSNTSNAASTSDMFIARTTTTNYTYDMAGSMDELRLWSSVRTAQEIQANMFSELSNYSGLIAYYKFNDDGSSTLSDVTSNGHNGTLQQFASTSNATVNNSASGWIFSTAPAANGYDGPGGVGSTNGQSNLMWWLKSDGGIVLNGSNVQTWQDQSGNANDVTQSNTASQPAFQSANSFLNDQSTVNFDGINSYMDFAGLTDAFTNYHSFYVFRTGSFNIADGFTALHTHNGWSPGYLHSQIHSSTGIWENAVNSTPAFAESSTAFTVNHNYAISLKSDALVQMRFFNGGTEGNTSAYAGNQHFGPGTLGAWNNAGSYERKANLQWAELVLFNRPLNRAQENIIYNYLSAKYAISLNAGNYYNETGSYNHDLIGIGNGNDGAHAVAEGGGLMLNNFGMLNDDGDYLVAAHDNGTGTNTVSDVTGVGYRYKRLWNVTNTDAAGTTGGRIGMSFDLGALGNLSSAVAPSDYSLLYTSDGLNFSSVSTLSSAIINDNTVQFVLNASSVVNGFYTVGAATQSVLPLHLLSFDVQAIEGNAVLSWQTLDEINVDKFEIEHSLDGSHFSRIGKLEANNSTAQVKYIFTHPHPDEGVNLYRLKIVDKNTDATYSQIKRLFFYATASLQIFPSPFNESFIVKIPEGETILSLELYDAAGRKIAFSKFKHSNFLTTKPIHAPAGMYVLKIVTNKSSYGRKIMKESK